MALQNSQYDRIMRDYNRRQIENRRLQEERQQEVYARLPEMASLDAEIASVSADAVRRSLFGENDAGSSVGGRIRQIEERQKKLLLDNGYPEDYLRLPCTCPLCGDTGYVDGQKCTCFRQAEIRLLYHQSGLEAVLEKDTFDHFSFDYYSDTMKNESTGLTALETARQAYRTAQRFVRDFDRSFDNLFLYGDTGVGKTFLSHCIAGELLKSARSVLYFTSHDLFETLARRTFDHTGEPDQADLILDCDLLIIDDLGTELTNAFIASRLFTCVSERILRRRSTIISTNLTLQDFSDIYSERTFSRIVSAYTMVKLIGKDIRIQKKFTGGH